MYLKPHFIHRLDFHKIKKNSFSDIPTLELVCRCSHCCSVHCTSIDEYSRGCLPTLLYSLPVYLSRCYRYSFFDGVATSTSLSSNKLGLIHSTDRSLVLNSVDFLNLMAPGVTGGVLLMYGGLVLIPLPLF